MREELNDTVSEKLHELDISAKVVTYTEYQRAQLTLVLDELKMISPKDLSTLAQQIIIQLKDPGSGLQDYLQVVDTKCMDKMKDQLEKAEQVQLARQN